MPEESEAVAVMFTVPETVAEDKGKEMETEGGVVSTGGGGGGGGTVGGGGGGGVVPPELYS